MTKKVAISVKPAPRQAPPDPDRWVERRDVQGLKRLTIDVPAGLHARIKSQCAVRGLKMADALREIMEREFPERSS